jgi:hypothetical protein
MTARKLAFSLAAALAAGVFGSPGRVLAQDVPAASPEPVPPSQTEAAPPQPEEAVPQYQVEVLIFAHRDFDRGEEQFAHEIDTQPPLRREELREPPVFDDTNFGPLAQVEPPGGAPLEQVPALGQELGTGAAGTETADPLAAGENEFRFRLLQPEELQLTSQYRIIERNSQAYVPLLHGGWVQPGLPESESRPIDLTMLGATNPTGSIRLYLSRFLHVDLDLSYQDAEAPPPAVAPAFGDELAEVTLPPRYRLVADRPARSNELHYFDHPAFGVLVRVTPVPEEPAPGTPGTRPAA